MKALAMLALLASGCSFIGVRAPPPTLPASGSFECTESNILPIVDTVPAVVAVAVLAFAALPLIAGNDLERAIGILIGAPALIVGVPYGVSATFGYVRTSRCRDQRARSVSFVENQDAIEKNAHAGAAPAKDDPSEESEAKKLQTANARARCIAWRIERSRLAQASEDPAERTRSLLALPDCEALFPVQP